MHSRSAQAELDDSSKFLAKKKSFEPCPTPKLTPYTFHVQQIGFKQKSNFHRYLV